jgi:sugar (pentulose or hexulose) kinase
MAAPPCILALDLGTSAFKAAAVSESGLIAEPVTTPYAVEQCGDRVTCPPQRYVDAAMDALARAATSARAAGCRVCAIGISSQAQTFVAVDGAGAPVADAVVWTDSRAEAEADEATRAIPDVTAHCGFHRFIGLQLLPKVIHWRRERATTAERECYLLLNEFVVSRLTGAAFGDETSHGMGGFFDISARAWSPSALALAGIAADQLAPAAPAASRSGPLMPDIARAIGIAPAPVYLCGNDQSCAAAGVNLDEPGSLLCSFGTAMVVYARRDELPRAVTETQIAGIDPLTSRYFLLGLESICGNAVAWLADRVCPGEGIDRLLRRVAAEADDPVYPAAAPVPAPPPTFDAVKAEFGRLAAAGPEAAARQLLERYRARFAQLVSEVQGPSDPPRRLVACGGLSKSPAWLRFLQQGTKVPIERAATEHPGLIGVHRIIARNPRQAPGPTT